MTYVAIHLSQVLNSYGAFGQCVFLVDEMVFLNDQVTSIKIIGSSFKMLDSCDSFSLHKT